MKVIEKKDLSDIHRRIDTLNQAVIQLCVYLQVELGQASAQEIIETLEENSWNKE